MPPPRSRARGSNDDDGNKKHGNGIEGASSDGGDHTKYSSSPLSLAARASGASASGDANGNGGGYGDDEDVLAERVLGVVLLLTSEWVEVGSGLAEISMRADTWGTCLSNMLLLQVRKGRGGGVE